MSATAASGSFERVPLLEQRQNRAKTGKYGTNPQEIRKNLWKSGFFD